MAKKIIKPGESQLDKLEEEIGKLLAVVQAQGQLLNLVDQYLLMQKRFFDQVKLNESPKEEKK